MRLSKKSNHPTSDDSRDVLTDLLACLRALNLHYFEAHWSASGDPYYGDHLLFERLYSNMLDEFDVLAEKLVAYYDEEAVTTTSQVSRIALFARQWEDYGDLYERSLRAEEDLQVLIEAAYHIVSEQGEMSLGLDDYLMALANDHETHIYLLKQRLR